MNNIKKLLIYPLAFIVFFGLTANECLDGLEDVATIQVPTDIEKTFEFKSDEQGNFLEAEIIELSSEEIDEYRDRINDFTAESLTVTVTDNMEGGSENATGALTFEFDGNTVPITFDAQNDLIPTLEATTLESVDGLKAYVERVLRNVASDAAGEEIEVTMEAQSEGGSFDYTINIVISGIVDAGA